VKTRRKKEEEKVSIFSGGNDMFPDGKRRKIEDDPSVAPINSSEVINVPDIREPLTDPHINLADYSSLLLI
jgi:hypothetical protein